MRDELENSKTKTRRSRAEAAELKAQWKRKRLLDRVIVTVWGLFKLSNWRIRCKMFRLWLVKRGCDVQIALFHLRRCRSRLLLRLADAIEAVLDRIERRS